MRRIMHSVLALVLFPVAGFAAERAVNVELRGSPESMVRQHEIAREGKYAFVETPKQLHELAADGRLVAFEGDDNYRVKGSRNAYARPEVRLLVERLSAQYREATGERLVVTSLTRPGSRQPGNAHRLSVHPAGMAVDLRVPGDPADRQWLENALLSLEAAGVLDATRERRPPHYHVAVFPEAYRKHVAARLTTEAAATVLPSFGRGGADPRGETGGDRGRAAALLSLAGLAAVWQLRRRAAAA